MTFSRKIVRWGTLTVLVGLMSGCCVLPWGPRGGYYEGGGGHDSRGGHGGYGGGGYRHGG